MHVCGALTLAVLLLPVPLLGVEPKSLSPPQVKVDYKKGTDFAKYKVFAWASPDEAPASAADHVRLTKGLEAALVEKGLAKAESGAPADLYVRYSSRVEKRRPVSSGPSESPWNNTPNQGWKVAVDLRKVDIGTLVIELSDGQSKAVVWRSKGEARVWGPEPMAELIEASLQQLNAVYPPRGGR